MVKGARSRQRDEELEWVRGELSQAHWELELERYRQPVVKGIRCRRQEQELEWVLEELSQAH